MVDVATSARGLGFEKGARPCDRTPSVLNGAAYLLCGQPGQSPVQSAIACTTAGAAAKAAVLADSSTMAAISFFMLFSIEMLILERCYAARGGGGSSAGSTPESE
jgi:hypothetical protein